MHHAVTWPVKTWSFIGTHKEEQDVSYVVESMNLTNLDDKSQPSWHLYKYQPTVVIITQAW